MITFIKISYDTSDGMPDKEFDEAMEQFFTFNGFVYDGSGTNLQSSRRDLYFYDK